MLFKRRLLLRSILSCSALVGGLVAMPKMAIGKWTESLVKAFDAESSDDALVKLYNSKTLIESEKIKLKVPEIAENGAVVPVSVKSSLPNVTAISIVAEKNPQPLAASFSLPKGTAADISVRIRLGETMLVKAIVESDGKLYSTKKEVKVTIGGCGG